MVSSNLGGLGICLGYNIDSFKRGSVNLRMFPRGKQIFKRRNGQKGSWSYFWASDICRELKNSNIHHRPGFHMLVLSVVDLVHSRQLCPNGLLKLPAHHIWSVTPFYTLLELLTHFGMVSRLTFNK